MHPFYSHLLGHSSEIWPYLTTKTAEKCSLPGKGNGFSVHLASLCKSIIIQLAFFTRYYTFKILPMLVHVEWVHSFYFDILFHCVALPQFIYAFYHWQACGLFPVWGYCRQCCNEHNWIGLLGHTERFYTVYTNKENGQALWSSDLQLYQILPTCSPMRVKQFAYPEEGARTIFPHASYMF